MGGSGGCNFKSLTSVYLRGVELGWTFAFSHRAGHRDVLKLRSIHRAPQQETSSTHVAASDEIGRKKKAFAKIFREDIHIFARRDAAEQNHLSAGGRRLRELPHVALERFAITRIIPMNIDFGKRTQFRKTDRHFRGKQSAIRRDHQDAGTAGAVEQRLRIGEFSAKIETAQKSKDLAECRAVRRCASAARDRNCARSLMIIRARCPPA